MSPASIQLTKASSNVLSCAEKSMWSLSVTAVGTNIVSEVFVYQAVPVTEPVPGDRYQCVASVLELKSLPVVAGFDKLRKRDGIYQTPYYRTATVTFACYSADELDQTWQTIQDQVQRLVDNYNQWQSLQTQETVTITSD